MTNPPTVSPPAARPRGALVMVVFAGAEILDLAGPLDLLCGAMEFGAPRRPALLVSEHGGPIATFPSGIVVETAALAAAARQPLDTLLVAGGRGIDAALARPRLVAWIARHAARARRVVSICTGAFLLAEAGLLGGRRATTHWAHIERFAARYPQVRVDADAIFVEDPPLFTSAGITAGMDLALHLVQQDHGSALALDLARQWLLYAQRPGGQSQFSSLLPSAGQARPSLRELCGWIADHLDGDLSVAALATRMAMSPRHFARVFQAELGVTPARYVETVRLEAARRWLEHGQHSIESVADACGIGASERLRRAFLRRLGVNPRDYRSRFERRAHQPNAH